MTTTDKERERLAARLREIAPPGQAGDRERTVAYALEHGSETLSDDEALDEARQRLGEGQDGNAPEEERILGPDGARPQGGGARRRPDTPGTPIAFEDIEPWPTPVNGLDLANEIGAAVRRHVVMSEDLERAVVLWTFLTWTYDASRVLPLLAISSPTPECGKTTLLELLTELVARPVPGSNITPAATFRVIEAARPCLLIDEADTFLNDRDELRGVINSGHTRATAFVLRSVGEGPKQEVRKFSTWCPKALALIRDLPETLARRSIPIRLEMKLPSEYPEYVVAGDERYRDLRRRLARWAEDHEDAAAGDVELPPSLFNRKGDNWRPMLSIARAIGGDWPAEAERSAIALTGERREEGLASLLLADLRTIFANKGDPDALPSQVLAEELVALEDRPWPEFGWQRKPLTTHGLASQLRHFGVRPHEIWFGDKNLRGYRREALASIWERYAPAGAPPGRTAIPLETAAESGKQGL
jgi:hypothetical protein